MAEPQYLTKQKSNEVDTGFTSIDIEEQNAGYQAAYSKLAASETGYTDPVGFIQDPQAFLGQSLQVLVKEKPQIRVLLIKDSSTQSFIQQLVSDGYSI